MKRVPQKESQDQSNASQTETHQLIGSFQFKDGRSATAVQRKMQSVMNSGHMPIQMKKDAAEHDFGDKGKPSGTTATKVINPKSGTRGLYKYKYSDGVKILDSFNGTNIANKETAKGTSYYGLTTPEITVAVASHDLASGDPPLSSSQLKNGSRSVHFRHADKKHKIDRKNKYTWHHLQNVGKMELIDMNVHGAMWHYGGIDGWKAATHPPGDAGDTTDDDD